MLIMLALAGGASAVGLGDLRGQPVLGEKLRLSVDVLGSEARFLDASCFRVVRPAGDADLPWLKKANFSVVPGNPPRLEIRSEQALTEPLMALAVQVGCGHGVVRQFVLAASPAFRDTPPAVDGRNESAQVPVAKAKRKPAPRPVKVHPKPALGAAATAVPGARGVGAAALPAGLKPAEGATVGLSQLSASELLAAIDGARLDDAQRQRLRNELKLILALGEQQAGQQATEAKLREMESNLRQLQQQASSIAEKVEVDAAAQIKAPASAVAEPAVPVAAPPAPPAAPVEPSAKPVPAAPEPGGLSPWSLLGALLGGALGAGGWMLWRRRGRSPESLPETANMPVANGGRRAEPSGAAVPAEATAVTVAERLVAEDRSLRGERLPPENVPPPEVAVASPKVAAEESGPATASLDEHFEASPVMELADIMLSFGRVKGAAQALQEYIDRNPQEALQPWMRLLDVYRMAGMRDEFESVASNLHNHFNVEVPQWDASKPVLGRAAGAEPEVFDANSPWAPRPESIEDMPRILGTVLELWWSGDVVGYLYQLLRDNRGGQRHGLALPVVEDILFLIELKETANRMSDIS